MPEDWIQLANEFDELFTDLAGVDKAVVLRTVTVGASVYDTATTTDRTLTRVLVNDDGTRQKLTGGGWSLNNKKVFKIGALDLDSNGDSATIEAMLDSAMHPQGGILYGSQLLPITMYERELIIGGKPIFWICVCDPPKR